MARMLAAALRKAGHEVEAASDLRSFSATPAADAYDAIGRQAEAEIARISALWSGAAAPDLWFCYHPYYKAPDLLGPRLAQAFGLPCVTAEASWSARRNIGAWAGNQALVADAVRQAAVNICFRDKDRAGLEAVAPDARFAMLAPFIDVAPFRRQQARPASRRILAAAMMRPGDKLESYRMLARALERIEHLAWTLAVAGDGPSRDEVRSEFARLDPGRIEWLGEKSADEMPAFYGSGALYAWPGFGEAYGLAYLEAQAAGLPVVAQAVDGVPGVVRDGATGLLTSAGDVQAFADAVARLLDDTALRQSMAEAARRFVAEERSFEVAAERLAGILRPIGAGP
jgi:glycosyltransferase involved in cell wall biosynthesis